MALQGVTQSEIERERYESRVKALMDQASILEWACRERGEARNDALNESLHESCRQATIRAIHVLEQWLNRSWTPREQLESLPMEDLSRIADQLLEEEVMQHRSRCSAAQRTERERYEARRKAILDHNTNMEFAKQDGRIEGEKIGAIRTIHAYERLLNRFQTPAEELTSRALDELTRLADQLLEQVLKQR